MIKKALLALLVLSAAFAPAAPAGQSAQRTIALPDEFRPEGIASGRGASFFVGSIPRGSVWRGSYKTGQGSELVPPHAGRNHIGLKVDKRFNRLFVAGGPSKAIYVYNSRTGADAAAFPLPDAGFVNDVVLTRRAAYFTDSLVQQLYRVPIRRNGTIGSPERIPLTGDIAYGPGFNVNGIEATRSGSNLILVQSNTGKLFRANASSGRTREIRVDQTLTNGDGLLLFRDALYVVQNRDNRIALVDLDRRLRRGRVERVITSPRFDVPTTIAPYKRFIYAVNARFDRPDTSPDDVVRLRRRD